MHATSHNLRPHTSTFHPLLTFFPPDPLLALRAASDTFNAITASAIESRNIPLFKEALSLGARPSSYINPILGLRPPSPDLLVALLDAGLDPNTTIPGHRGVLLNAAAATGKVEYVELLLARGADPNIVGPNATGPLRGHGGWMANSLGPLGAAIEGYMAPREEKDVLEAIEALVNGGAKVAGSGALQVAARTGQAECVRVLVERGADVAESVPRVEKGRTAVELAEEGGYEGIADFLRRHGAV